MTEKKCTQCSEIKLLENFYKNKLAKDGHMPYCKTCHKKYYETNKNKILEYRKEYYETNKDNISEYQHEWRKANKESISEYQREYRKVKKDELAEQKRQYYQNNKGYFAASSKKRKAIKKTSATTDPWELQQIAIFYADRPDSWHVDHIIPLKLGGKHELANLQHLESWMNLSKKDKHPDDWNDPRPISCRA